MPVVPKETDVAGSASVATIVTKVSTAPTTAPPARWRCFVKRNNWYGFVNDVFSFDDADTV